MSAFRTTALVLAALFSAPAALAAGAAPSSDPTPAAMSAPASDAPGQGAAPVGGAAPIQNSENGRGDAPDGEPAPVEGTAPAEGTSTAASTQQDPTEVQTLERLDPQGTPRGAVLVVHGGAWNGHGAGAVDKVRPVAARMVRRGFTAYLVDYQPGAAGFDDVAQAYREARSQTPRGLPVCVWGESSGGHYALMLDVRFNPDCVMAVAAPTDLRRLNEHPTDLHDYVQQLARDVFGSSALDLNPWSPSRNAAALGAPTALLYSRDDLTVDEAQGHRLAQRLKRARLVVGHEGQLPFVHGSIDADSAARFIAAERSVLNAAGARAARR